MRQNEAFRSAVARARVIEIAVATWLMERGCLILPVYDYSGLGENKAPKLQAFSATDSLVTPDLLVARSGLLSWCEVKWKSGVIHYRKTNERETGIDLRLWHQYQKVKAVTGAKVFLLFAHSNPEDSVITCDELAVLDALPQKRESARGRGGHPPMINWPIRLLHRMASYDDVIREAA